MCNDAGNDNELERKRKLWLNGGQKQLDEWRNSHLRKQPIALANKEHRKELERKKKLWENGGHQRLIEWRHGRDHTANSISITEEAVVFTKAPYIQIGDMNGAEFEIFCAELLQKNGFKEVIITKTTGDQGVDILATKDDVRFAIQCKHYASNVGNDAVQQAYAGRKYYGCHVGVVMTNSSFTESAVELAGTTGILLWGGQKIEKMMEQAAKQDVQD